MCYIVNSGSWVRLHQTTAPQSAGITIHQNALMDRWTLKHAGRSDLTFDLFDSPVVLRRWYLLLLHFDMLFFFKRWAKSEGNDLQYSWQAAECYKMLSILFSKPRLLSRFWYILRRGVLAHCACITPKDTFSTENTIAIDNTLPLCLCPGNQHVLVLHSPTLTSNP